MTGFVYAIWGAENTVKIGWSADPIKRLSKIASDCPAEPRLLGLIPATKAQEGEIKDLLAPWCVRREWFRFEGPVLAFVESLPRPSPKAVARRACSDGAHDLRKWRYEARVTLDDLAARVGIRAPHLSMIENGKRVPSMGTASRLSEISGVAIESFVRRAP